MHKHHIIPKHAGGTDDPENLVLLSIEDHAEAHRLLWEKYGRKYDQIAWLSLTKQITGSEARILAVKEANTGKIHTEETRKKLSAAKIGKKQKLKSIQKRKSTREKTISSRPYKYQITTPENTIEITNNLTKYCKEFGLDQSVMIKVLHGKRNHYKQYRVKEI